MRSMRKETDGVFKMSDFDLSSSDDEIKILSHFSPLMHKCETAIREMNMVGNSLEGAIDLKPGNFDRFTGMTHALLLPEHTVIQYSTGQGASTAALNFEAEIRSNANVSSLVIPLQVENLRNTRQPERLVYTSLANLVEALEIVEYPQDMIDELSDAYARILSVNKGTSKRFLSTIQKKNDNPLGSISSNMHLLGRSGFIHRNASRNKSTIQFIEATKRKLRSATPPRDLEEMVGLVRKIMGNKTIYITVDLPDAGKSKRVVSSLTNQEFLDELNRLNIKLKIFAPKGSRVKSKEVAVIDSFFEWTDDQIKEMIAARFRAAGSWIRNLDVLQADNELQSGINMMDLIIENANHNPRRALQMVHILLGNQVVGSSLTKQKWNQMCDNWKFDRNKPKKI